MVEYDTSDAARTALFADLNKDIAASKPTSLLLFAMSDLEASKAFPIPRITAINSTEDLTDYLASPPAHQQFDLAVVILAAEDIEESDCIHLISKLRDTECARVYIACNVSPETAQRHHDADFRSLGFKLLRIYNARGIDETDIYLYYYDIYDYKEVPDWLNDRFWAHPNMWDKARW